MFRMHRNNLNLIFLVYSNLTPLDTMLQKEFTIKTLLASNTDRSISQNGNYPYVWKKSLPHPWKTKFSPVPLAVLAWNFVECYFRALVKIRNRISRNKTSKWEEMSFLFSKWISHEKAVFSGVTWYNSQMLLW